MKKLKSVLFVVLAATLAGCFGSDPGGPSSGTATTAVLKGTGFTGRRALAQLRRLSDPVAFTRELLGPGSRAAIDLNNITGMADSLLILTTEDGCGFTAWSANSVRGEVAIAGRELETFNLGNPADWTSTGSGIRDICNGGTIIGIEAYFGYMDFDLTFSGTDYMVRIAMGSVDPYEPGDVLVYSGGTFNWIDDSGSTLTPLASGRPASPYRYDSIESFTPFYDGGSSNQTVLEKLELNTDAPSEAITLDQTISKVVVTVDFTSASITASDTSNATSIAKTLSIPFLNDYSTFAATVTALTADQIGGDDDPEPEIGNGSSR